MSSTITLTRQWVGGEPPETFTLDVMEGQSMTVRRTLFADEPGVLEAEDVRIEVWDADRTIYEFIVSIPDYWDDASWKLRATIDGTVYVRDWPVRLGECGHDTVSGMTTVVAYDPLSQLRDLHALNDVWTVAEMHSRYEWPERWWRLEPVDKFYLIDGELWRWYIRDMIEHAMSVIGIDVVVFEWNWSWGLPTPYDNVKMGPSGYYPLNFQTHFDRLTVLLDECEDDPYEPDEYHRTVFADSAYEGLQELARLLGLIIRYDDINDRVTVSTLDQLPFSGLSTITLNSEDLLEALRVEDFGRALGEWRGVYVVAPPIDKPCIYAGDTRHQDAETTNSIPSEVTADSGIVRRWDKEQGADDVLTLQSATLSNIGYLKNHINPNEGDWNAVFPWGDAIWHYPFSTLVTAVSELWYNYLHGRVAIRTTVGTLDVRLGQAVSLTGSDVAPGEGGGGPPNDPRWTESGWIFEIEQDLIAGTSRIGVMVQDTYPAPP